MDTQKPVEGPEAAKLFDALVHKVLSVPHDEIARRESEYRRQSARNPPKARLKPKVKPSA